MKLLQRFFNLKREYQNALRVGWFLAFRQIRRSGKGTTTLIIFVMVLTFLNLVVVSGLLVGLIVGSFEQFRESYSGEVIVTSESGREYIENSPGLIAFLNNHPKVQAMSARHGASGSVLGTLSENTKKKERPNQIGARITSIDPVAEQTVTGFSRFLKRGENLTPGQQGYILIGSNMIKKYSSFADANIPGLDLLTNVDVGSKVRLTIGSGPSAASKDLTVKGIVKSKVDEISTRMFILDSELRSMLLINKEQYQEIAIKTERSYAPVLAGEIKAYMGSNAARIQTSDEAIPSFLRNIEATMTVLGNALSSIALVVASITIFIVIFINAVTRRKFIGIMKGIGISPRAVEISYTIQALFYGIIGSVIGLALTFGFLKPYFTANPIDFPFSDGILVVSGYDAAVRVTILLCVTIFAGYVPAKLIVRKNTLDSILGR